jgi:thiamine pyrophosphate-dependent acetolactate synthase large subunit-like protein
MNSVELLKEFTRQRGDAAVIVGPSKNSGVLYHQEHQPATIYNMELGYTTAIALGLAMAVPAQKVVALEGDGSMIAGIGVLSTVALNAPENLVILMLDNGTYGSIGQGDCESATAAGLKLANVAIASGLAPEKVREVNDLAAFGAALSSAMTEPGPWMICATTERYGTDIIKRAPLPEQVIVESVVFFRREMIARGFAFKD